MDAYSSTPDAARAYLTYGWSVVPLPPGRKEPLLKNWDRMPRLEPEQIPGLFKNDSNIGLL
jgi:hypothetical protein